MNKIKKMFGFMQPYVTSVFFALLILSFIMAGFVFNIAVNAYIINDAADSLREARAVNDGEVHNSGIILNALRRNQHVSEVYHFKIDTSYEPADFFLQSDAVYIAEALAAERIPLVLTESMRLQLNHNTFYLSIIPDGEDITIFYLDISENLAFGVAVKRLLLASVGIVLLFSLIVAGFFADSVMRPLKVLHDFVRQIGRGDFTPNTYTFASDEFNELNDNLNNTARQLAKYDNEQKTFFQNVSHELRTPLMLIKSYSEGIHHGLMEPKSASETILEATNRLAGMVDEILYVSRLDNVAAPAMEKINLCVIVEDRIRKQQPMAESKGMTIVYLSDGEIIKVKCAVTYMERAVDNLISNAIRYAKNTITVECYAIGGLASVRVSDDGPGFEPDALPQVFERFYRGKNGLSGIGLSTVKSIIDQHKGMATAENGNESGAVLTISIPRKKPKG